MIRGINSEKISKQISLRGEPTTKAADSNQKLQEDRAAQAREKALAFAKSIPKPKPKKREGNIEGTDGYQDGSANPSPTQTGGQAKKQPKNEKKLDEAINKVEDDLEALERQHLFYQEKINKLKS